MKYACCLLVAVLCCSLSAFSQGQYLDDGQDGFGIQADYTANSAASGLDGLLGYSIMGRVDIQASVGQQWLTQQISGYNVTELQFSPGVNAYVLKEDQANVPGTLELSIAYQTGKFSSHGLDLGNQTEKEHGLEFGATALKNFDMSPDSYAQPFIGAAYSTATAEFTNSSSQTLTQTESKPIFSLGVSFIFKNPPSEKFAIRPEVDIDKDYTTIGISAMLIL
jgi:hypothetical protein